MSKINSFSSYDRSSRKTQLGKDEYDLLVIGGGATGCGIALDAAARGLKTALVEKRDFASGTSSKSTKLIHGGLRYLKQLEVGLVRESGTERAIVNKIAPHLCLPEKMLLPIIVNGTFGKYSTSLGLWVYDKVAGVAKEDSRVMLSKKQAQAKEPLLDPTTLKGAGYYAEYRTDDARLTIELIKKAATLGALPINYMEVTGFDYTGDRISGVTCTDLLDHSQLKIKAKQIVSAGGPWVDKLRAFNNSVTGKRLQLTKGVHIVVPHERLPLKQSVYFDVPDGRMIFAIPRGKVTYIGTTDTVYTGSLDRVVATELDRDYLLNAVNNTFPTVTISRYDIISNWAGLRPLIHEDGKSPSELSRKDEIFEAPDGLVSIAGGKLTGYRKMAERIVDKVAQKLSRETGVKFDKSNTKKIALTPQPLSDNKAVRAYIAQVSDQCKKAGLDPQYGWYLVTNYGRQAANILTSALEKQGGDHDINIALSEVNFCLDHEMIQRAEDFFVRRTGRLYFDILSIAKVQEPVLERLSEALNWTPERLSQEREILASLIKDATHYYESEDVPALVHDVVGEG